MWQTKCVLSSIGSPAHHSLKDLFNRIIIKMNACVGFDFVIDGLSVRLTPLRKGIVLDRRFTVSTVFGSSPDHFTAMRTILKAACAHSPVAKTADNRFRHQKLSTMWALFWFVTHCCHRMRWRPVAASATFGILPQPGIAQAASSVRPVCKWACAPATGSRSSASKW